jgi:hypothetical protein
MRTIALACVSLALSTSALAGPIDDQFAAGVGGVPWGMKLAELIAIRPGGDQYFSTSAGERVYTIADDEPLFGIPRPGMRVQYHFGKQNEVRSIAVGVPYERRDELLGQLLLLFGRHFAPTTTVAAIDYDWPADRRVLVGVRASRDPQNGILEFWVGYRDSRDR